jgi:hypothetical protein
MPGRLAAPMPGRWAATRRPAAPLPGDVADDNPRAAALYLRPGFGETGCRYLDRYEVVDLYGMRHVITEPCRFLVKELT